MTTPATFEIPARIQRRLDAKDAPAPRKQAQPLPAAPQPSSEIILITDWPAYREMHPELVFSGKFDLQGRPIWAAEERTK